MTGTVQDRDQDLGTALVNVRLLRVVFQNDTGWTVARARLDGPAPDGTPPGAERGFGLLGEIEASTGDVLAVAGRWETDPRYGLQLRASMAQRVMGGTEADLAAFLAATPGVGLARARRALRDLGGREAVLAALESPGGSRLADALGASAAKAAAEAYGERRGVGESLAFLTRLFPKDRRLVAELLSLLKGQARKLIEADPYQLVGKAGLDFRRVDQVALSALGAEPTDPRRTRAAALAALRMAEDEGHVFSELSEVTGRAKTRLAAKIRKAFGLDADQLKEGFLAAAKTWTDPTGTPVGPLVVIRGGGDEGPGGVFRVWSADLDRAEAQLAAHLARLLDQDQETPDLEIPDASDLWGDVEPSKEQRLAVEALAKSPVLILTGGPGCGKTFTVRALLDLLEHNEVPVACCAPTGKAAKRMSEQTGREASTIHRLLAYHPDLGFRHDDGEPIYGDSGEWIGGGPLDTGAVVLDEASMVSTDLFAALVAAIPSGARLVIVGDVDQLPSIGPGACLSDLIRSGEIPVVRLVRIFRQAADSRIPYLARDINEGCLPNLSTPDDGAAQDVLFIAEDNADALADLVVQAVAEVLPRENPKRGRRGFDPIDDVQVLCPQRVGAVGTERLNLALQARLNPAPANGKGSEGVWIGGGYRARPGDKVLHVRNDYELDVFNGDQGVVLAADFKGLPYTEVKELFDPAKGSKNPMPEGLRPKGKSGRISQILAVDYQGRTVLYGKAQVHQLILGYACTVHKFQGSQAPCIILPIHESHDYMTTRALLYTAVTRASELLVLMGQSSQIGRSAENTRGSHRRTTLVERLSAAVRGLTGQVAASDPDKDERAGEGKTSRRWIDDL